MTFSDYRADLHIHSTFSDGVMTPFQLTQAASAIHLNAMAITDHDNFGAADFLAANIDKGLPCHILTTDDNAENLAEQNETVFIPGVELSIDGMKGLHLLGYGLTSSTKLHTAVKQLSELRRERAAKIVELLKKMGCPVDMEQLSQKSDGSIGRPHIARMMVDMGYVSSMQEAFSLYIGEGKPAYVAGERMDMITALRLMRQNGFVPVLAHPFELEKEDYQLRPLISQWKDNGLMGIEVYHPSAHCNFQPLIHFAEDFDLLMTGGSDFHAPSARVSSDNIPDGGIHAPGLGGMCQYWQNSQLDVIRLIDAVKQQKAEYEKAAKS